MEEETTLQNAPFSLRTIQDDMRIEDIVNLPAIAIWPSYPELSKTSTRRMELNRLLKTHGMQIVECETAPGDNLFGYIAEIVYGHRDLESQKCVIDELAAELKQNHGRYTAILKYGPPHFKFSNKILASNLGASRCILFVAAKLYRNLKISVIHIDLETSKLMVSSFSDNAGEAARELCLVGDQNKFHLICGSNRPIQAVDMYVTVKQPIPNVRWFCGIEFEIPWNIEQHGQRRQFRNGDDVFELTYETVGETYRVDCFKKNSRRPIRNGEFPMSVPIKYRDVTRKKHASEYAASQNNSAPVMFEPEPANSETSEQFPRSIQALIEKMDEVPGAMTDGARNSRIEKRDGLVDLNERFNQFKLKDEEPIRILLVGELGFGKSTLASRILRENLVDQQSWSARAQFPLADSDVRQPMITDEEAPDEFLDDRVPPVIEDEDFDDFEIDVFPTNGQAGSTTRQPQLAKTSFKSVGFKISRVPRTTRIERLVQLREFAARIQEDYAAVVDEGLDAFKSRVGDEDLTDALGLIGITDAQLFRRIGEEGFTVDSLTMPREIWNRPDEEVMTWESDGSILLSTAVAQMAIAYRQALMEPPGYYGLVDSSTIYLPLKMNLELVDPPGAGRVDMYSHGRVITALRDPFDVLLLAFGKGHPSTDYADVLARGDLRGLFNNHAAHPFSIGLVWSLGKEAGITNKLKRVPDTVRRFAEKQKPSKLEWLRNTILTITPHQEALFQEVCKPFFLDVMNELGTHDGTTTVAQLNDYIMEVKKSFRSRKEAVFFHDLIRHWCDLWDDMHVYWTLQTRETRDYLVQTVNRIGTQREFFKNFDDLVQSALDGVQTGSSRSSATLSKNTALEELGKKLKEAAERCDENLIAGLLDDHETIEHARYSRPSGKFLGKDLSKPPIFPNGELNLLTKMMFQPLLDAINTIGQDPRVALSGINHERAKVAVLEQIHQMFQKMTENVDEDTDKQRLQLVLGIEEERFQRTINEIIRKFEETEQAKFTQQLHDSKLDEFVEYVQGDLFAAAASARQSSNPKRTKNQARLLELKKNAKKTAINTADAIFKHLQRDVRESRKTIRRLLFGAITNARERLRGYSSDELKEAFGEVQGQTAFAELAGTVAQSLVALVDHANTTFGPNDHVPENSSIQTARNYLVAHGQTTLSPPTELQTRGTGRRRRRSPSQEEENDFIATRPRRD